MALKKGKYKLHSDPDSFFPPHKNDPLTSYSSTILPISTQNMEQQKSSQKLPCHDLSTNAQSAETTCGAENYVKKKAFVTTEKRGFYAITHGPGISLVFILIFIIIFLMKISPHFHTSRYPNWICDYQIECSSLSSPYSTPCPVSTYTLKYAASRCGQVSRVAASFPFEPPTFCASSASARRRLSAEKDSLPSLLAQTFSLSIFPIPYSLFPLVPSLFSFFSCPFSLLFPFPFLFPFLFSFLYSLSGCSRYLHVDLGTPVPSYGDILYAHPLQTHTYTAD